MTVRCLDASARAEHSRPAILLSMEPHPPDHGPGRIIFLNGASSSGKSPLAKAMQQASPGPFPHVPPDHLAASGMRPARRDPDGPSARWQQMRPRIFDGLHRRLPALAAAGNNLPAGHITGFPAWRGYLATLPGGPDVFLAGGHGDLAGTDRRERDPGDRRTGQGRPHAETGLIRAFGPCGSEAGATSAAPSAAAAPVLAAWRTRTRRRALGQGMAGNRETSFVPIATALGAADGDVGSALVNGFEEFQPVAERVLGVEAAHPGEAVVEEDGSACAAKPASPGVQAADQQARMRLAGRAEVLLHAKVQLDAMAAEPAAAAGGEHGRLGQFPKAQHPAVEVAQCVLAAGRAGQLHVMDHPGLPQLS